VRVCENLLGTETADFPCWQQEGCVYVQAKMDTVTYISLWMQLDEELPAPETQLPYLGPRECVDADQVLKDENAHVSDGQVKFHTFMILHANSNNDHSSDIDYQKYSVLYCIL